jgi:DNA (cytosine-5)-methyltransferase 1
MGYHLAGFEVTGVDIAPQPRYPFKFIQADAVTFPLDGFDVIHASPPCQGYSRSMRHLAGDYPRLIEPMRNRLVAHGRIWVIENVPGAPLATESDLFGAHGTELCGTMFGLRIWRHRLFETSVPVNPPRNCDHSVAPINPYRESSRQRLYKQFGTTSSGLGKIWREEMGVGWMNKPEGSEAVPVAYTEYIGRQFMDYLGAPARVVAA